MKFLNQYKKIFRNFSKYSLVSKALVVFIVALSLIVPGLFIWMVCIFPSDPKQTLELLALTSVIIVIANLRMVETIREMQVDEWKRQRRKSEPLNPSTLFLIRTVTQLLNLGRLLKGQRVALPGALVIESVYWILNLKLRGIRAYPVMGALYNLGLLALFLKDGASPQILKMFLGGFVFSIAVDLFWWIKTLRENK